jgi:hypothetical protein
VIAGLPHPPRMNREERRFRRLFSELLMDPHLLPILDCEPNVVGHGARPMPIRDQERFIRAWAHRTLPDVDLGVCPARRSRVRRTPAAARRTLRS